MPKLIEVLNHIIAAAAVVNGERLFRTIPKPTGCFVFLDSGRLLLLQPETFSPHYEQGKKGPEQGRKRPFSALVVNRAKNGPSLALLT